jgi:hypothetical protein
LFIEFECVFALAIKGKEDRGTYCHFGAPGPPLSSGFVLKAIIAAGELVVL